MGRQKDSGIGRPMIFAQLFEAGQWYSPFCRLYVDLGAEQGAAMSRAPTEVSDDEEPGGQVTQIQSAL